MPMFKIMNKKQFKKDLWVWTIVFGLLTLPFIFTDIDIALQKPYFDIENGWYMRKIPFWDFIYKYGIFLGYFLVVAALAMVSISYWKKAAVKWRRPAVFLILVMIIGPGVLVNATLKDHWGHPRPREIKEFGGKEDYVKVWMKGPTKGKSFPCGHASMGFFMSIPFLFLRNRYRKWAWVFFGFGTLYGLLIGYARMIAGGHFAGDVLWAAGIVWLTGILLYHLLNVNKPIDVSDFNSAQGRRKRRLATVLVGAVLPALTVALLLATPYITHRQFRMQTNDLKEHNIEQFNIHFAEGVVNLSYGNEFLVDFKVNAFGFPNSKIGWKWNPGQNTDFSLIRMGWFTEVRNEIELTLVDTLAWEHSLVLDNGSIYFEVPTDTIALKLDVELKKGNFYLSLNESISDNALSISNESFDESNQYFKSIKVGAMQLNIQLSDKVNLVIE